MKLVFQNCIFTHLVAIIRDSWNKKKKKKVSTYTDGLGTGRYFVVKGSLLVSHQKLVAVMLYKLHLFLS